MLENDSHRFFLISAFEYEIRNHLELIETPTDRELEAVLYLKERLSELKLVDKK